MRRTLTLVLCLFVSGQMAVVAQDWPQWRGPARDGSVSAASAPAAWPASYIQGWRADIGEGYSSPVVVGGRVFVHSRRDPNEIVTALDLTSGKTVWQHTYDAAYTKNSYATKMAKGPNATPLVAAGRLFTLGASGKLAAWDAATGPRRCSRWTRRAAKPSGSAPRAKRRMRARAPISTRSPPVASR